MERICKNCQHFTLRDFSNSSPLWGECMKSVTETAEISGREAAGAFMWDDKSCGDFEQSCDQVLTVLIFFDFAQLTCGSMQGML